MKIVFSVIAMLTLCASAMAQTPAVAGDVDCDGYVTTTDVTAIYNYLLNDDMTNYSTCDVDGDGSITIADVTFIYNILLGGSQGGDTHEYVDLGLPSGTLWATMNVGANAPEEYGDYFAWGETTTKDVYNWTTYQWCTGKWNTMTKYCTKSNHGYNGFVDNKTELDPEDDAATANWGSQWCMPSKEQQDELLSQCTWQWTTSNGVKGYKVTSRSNGATIFFPAAGYYDSGTLYSTEKMGYYWSRTLSADKSYEAWYFYFYQSSALQAFAGNRLSGYTVRAVRVSQK